MQVGKSSTAMCIRVHCRPIHTTNNELNFTLAAMEFGVRYGAQCQWLSNILKL